MPGRVWWKDNGSQTTVPGPTGFTASSAALKGQAAGNEYKKAIASVAVGLSGVFGAASVASPDSGFSQINPEQIAYVLGGSFAMGENVTVQVTATYSDATTATYTPAAFTGTGTTNKVISDFSALIKTNVGISSLSFVAKTDQASTSATVAINVYGINLV